MSKEASVVEREDSAVMFKRAADEQQAITRVAQRSDHDPTRPSIEFYRRRDVIDLLLPIA